MNIKLIDVTPKNIKLPTEGTIKLNISGKEGKEELNPSDLDRVLKSTLDYLKDYKQIAIEPSIKAYDEEIGELRETSEAQAKSLEVKFNKELEKLIANLQNEADRRVNEKWEMMQKENEAFRKFKIMGGVKIIWCTIKIGKGIAGLVASAGTKADEYFKIANSCRKIAKQVKTLLATEEKVREDVNKIIEKMAKAKDPKKHVSELNSQIEVYKCKLTSLRQEAGKLSKELSKLLDKQDMGAEVTQEERTQIKAMIEEIIKLNKLEENGKQFREFSLKWGEKRDQTFKDKIDEYAKKIKGTQINVDAF